MAKSLHNDVFDAALDKIATCTNLSFCESEPANYGEIAAKKNVSTTLTAGNGNGSYTIAAGDTSGRKVTIAAQTGMSVSLSTSGSGVAWAVLDDGVTMLAKTSVTPQVVTSGQTWNSPAFDIEIQDPS